MVISKPGLANDYPEDYNGNPDRNTKHVLCYFIDLYISRPFSNSPPLWLEMKYAT